jgi:hypothetical protein
LSQSFGFCRLRSSERAGRRSASTVHAFENGPQPLHDGSVSGAAFPLTG